MRVWRRRSMARSPPRSISRGAALCRKRARHSRIFGREEALTMFDRRLFRAGGPVKPEEREWPSFRGAINEGMREEMRRDPAVFQMGEDIAFASPFGVTTGLAGGLGIERITESPWSEVAACRAA